jgi:hypothetical protein
MKYEKIGSGFINKNPKHTPNSTQPVFIGNITLEGEDNDVGVALWKNDKNAYGKESYSVSLTRKEED